MSDENFGPSIHPSLINYTAKEPQRVGRVISLIDNTHILKEEEGQYRCANCEHVMDILAGWLRHDINCPKCTHGCRVLRRIAPLGVKISGLSGQNKFNQPWYYLRTKNYSFERYFDTGQIPSLAVIADQNHSPIIDKLFSEVEAFKDVFTNYRGNIQKKNVLEDNIAELQLQIDSKRKELALLNQLIPKQKEKAIKTLSELQDKILEEDDGVVDTTMPALMLED